MYVCMYVSFDKKNGNRNNFIGINNIKKKTYLKTCVRIL